MEHLTLSDQAMGAIMMALQRSLLEQSDIVPVLKGFKLVPDDSGEIVVLNPPIVKAITEALVRYCHSQNLTTFTDKTGNKEVGSVVKDSIEEFRRDLDDQRALAGNRSYDG